MLADDHEVVRSGISNALKDLPHVEIISEVGNGISLKQQLLNLRPDCLLIDVAMPDFDAISDIKEIRSKYPELKILVVSAHDDDVYVQGLLGLGVNGYHLKDQPLNDLKLAVERILAGQKWVSSSLLDKLVPSAKPAQPVFDLTRRQKEILQQLQLGHDNQTIARNCSLSVKTVENHLTRIYRQLGVQSRLEAVNLINSNPSLIGGSSPSFSRPSSFNPTMPAMNTSTAGHTILVVDDNPRYRNMLSRTLQNLIPGGRIYEAGSIADAISVVKSVRPKLVFIDVVLGNENGIDCVKAINKLPRAPRSVLMSAYPDQEFRKSGRQAGAAALIDKKDLSVAALRQILADL